MAIEESRLTGPINPILKLPAESLSDNSSNFLPKNFSHFARFNSLSPLKRTATIVPWLSLSNIVFIIKSAGTFKNSDSDFILVVPGVKTSDNFISTELSWLFSPALANPAIS